MQKKITTAISFTPSEIEDILKEYVFRNTNMQVNKVSFDIKTETTGYGMNERDEKVFSGATLSGLSTINIHDARAIRAYTEVSSLGEQIDAVENDSRPMGDK